jgi:hypothetical protein
MPRKPEEKTRLIARRTAVGGLRRPYLSDADDVTTELIRLLGGPRNHDLSDAAMLEHCLDEPSSRRSDGAGFIYILSNPAMPGLLKIGRTTRNSLQRALEVSGGTGLPVPYVVEYESRVDDCSLAEKRIHQQLHKYRENVKREFFRLPLQEAIRTVKDICWEIDNP